jgi:hypothetical protein
MDDGERQAGRHAFGDYPQRDTGCPIQEPSLLSPAAPVRAILRLRAVRDLPARIMAFGIWPVHVDC